MITITKVNSVTSSVGRSAHLTKRISGQLNPVNKSSTLHRLCESNYQLLIRLIPELHQLKCSAVALATTKPPLHLSLIDKTAHTVTLELNHLFEASATTSFEPALKLRIYLDVQSAEVLSAHNHPDIAQTWKTTQSSRAVMDYKWSLNYFLEKWLYHCLDVGYQFK